MAFGTSQCQDGVEVLKCYEWRCQGTIKDALENLKNTKKCIKKDSNRHFDKKLINLWTYVQIFSLNFSVRGVLSTIIKLKKTTIVSIICHPWYW